MREPERHSLSLKTWLSYYSHSEGRREAGQTQCWADTEMHTMLSRKDAPLAIPGWPLGSAYRGVGWLCPPLGQPYPGDSLLVGRALPWSPQAWSDPTTCKIGWSVASLLRSFTWTLITLRCFQFPRNSGSASLPGLTRNSGPLQQHPDWGFLSSRTWLPHLLCGDSTQSQHHCPQGHIHLLLRLTVTCGPTHTSVPGSWEKRGPTPWR